MMSARVRLGAQPVSARSLELSPTRTGTSTERWSAGSSLQRSGGARAREHLGGHLPTDAPSPLHTL
jgi:hypothetical protein